MPVFSVVDYYARTSLASLAKKPAKQFDLSAITSPFQRKMVQRDLDKDFLKALEVLSYDVLLIDFIDDRFSLICLPDDSAFTDSNEFRKAGVNLRGLKLGKIPSFSDEYYAIWELGWEKLKLKLKELDSLKKLLVNGAYWCTKDNKGFDFENRSHINAGNEYLSRVYERLRLDLPKNQFVNYDGVEFVANAEHQWGRSPFHYVEQIETACLASVRRLHASAGAS
jgi:hypothetical protein